MNWDKVKTWAFRAVVDVVVLALIGGVVLIGVWAWHGQAAYVYLQQIVAQQQAQQRAQQPSQPK